MFEIKIDVFRTLKHIPSLSALGTLACPIDGRQVSEVVVRTLEFCFLGDTLSSSGGCTSAIHYQQRCKVA